MLGENEVLELMDERGMAYVRHEHEAVFTVEAAEALGLPHEGPHWSVPCKNLFLRDDKKRAYFLVTAPDHKRVDLRALSARIPSRRLSFASESDLGAMLGLIAGAVTPLGILNDEARRVTMVFDEELKGRWIDAHPLTNTATVQLAASDVEALVREHGNEVIWRDTGA
ncbi:MAG: prolyl-tRNA synthetase associated domain-containing protein [Coriobacteriales bacterium]|nr:prolyl-tRNA synthetase associated domain-containing protein [Coriobacteriales bacterium]